MKSVSQLSPAQLAQARSHSYRLFSQLYLQGITAVTLPTLQQLPELAAHLPQPFDPDTSAASHVDLFQHNIFPYESFFLSDAGLLGGRDTAVVQQHYQQRGYSAASSGTEADHLGNQLGFLAFLTAAEADAWADNLPHEAARLRTHQQQFLHSHLLRWAIPCLLAIQQQPDPFFATVAQLTLDLLLQDYEDLAETVCPEFSEGAVPPPNFLPPTQNILANEKTGFKQIAHHLVAPALSGIVLSRSTIAQLARQHNLPRGFGGREQMLLNLLRTAVQYDTLPPLLTALQKTCQTWQSSYQQLAQSHPQAGPFLQPWQERTKLTEKIVAELLASTPTVD